MLDNPGRGRNTTQRRHFIGGSDAHIIMGSHPVGYPSRFRQLTWIKALRL
jgi:predicted phage-related endonuclease